MAIFCNFWLIVTKKKRAQKITMFRGVLNFNKNVNRTKFGRCFICEFQVKIGKGQKTFQNSCTCSGIITFSKCPKIQNSSQICLNPTSVQTIKMFFRKIHYSVYAQQVQNIREYTECPKNGEGDGRGHNFKIGTATFFKSVKIGSGHVLTLLVVSQRADERFLSYYTHLMST